LVQNEQHKLSSRASPGTGTRESAMPSRYP
jgi:hypothetical protein